jgi:hypothetical protein
MGNIQERLELYCIFFFFFFGGGSLVFWEKVKVLSSLGSTLGGGLVRIKILPGAHIIKHFLGQNLWNFAILCYTPNIFP